jgi:hypothetical protein
MKRTLFFITVIALVCMGCGREERGKLTKRGKEIHDSWLLVSQTIIENNIVPTFQMDAWINGDDNIRRMVEDAYFPYMRIRQDYVNVYSLYDGAEKVLSVNTNGYTLADNGAVWEICIFNPTPGYDNGARPQFMSIPEHWYMTVTKTANQQWEIQLDAASCMGSNFDWQFTLPAQDTNVYFSYEEFFLAGKGTFKYSGDVYLHYNIDETLQHEGCLYPWYKGIVSMTANFIDALTLEAPLEDIHVKAKYGYNGEVTITYCDITETWNIESSPNSLKKN